MNRLFKAAFTLIELLVVIAIIGILSGLIVVTMNGVTAKATIAKAQVFSNSLRNALMMNLVSEWKFDSDASDSWGDNEGTSFGSPIYKSSSECISGQCLSFDGTDDYVNIPDSSSWTFGTGGFSINFWVKLNEASPASRKPIISGGPVYTSDSDTFSFYQSDGGKWEISLLTTNKGWASGSASDITNWHNITIVRESGINDFYVFLDGVRLSGTVLSGGWGIASVNFNWNVVNFGRSWDSGKFKGLIDDARIFNAAMPTSQVKEQYYVGLNNLFANGEITREEYLEKIVGIK